jgi:hypothetical protein
MTRPLGGAVGRIAAASLLIVTGASAMAAEAPRLPHPRPPLQRDAASPDAQTARLPRPRPFPRPPQRLASVEPGAPGLSGPPPAAEPEDVACLKRLSALGVRFVEEPPIATDTACAVWHPLRVTALGSGVAITPDATFNCRMAEALALWTRDVLVPSAREMLGAVPTAIVHDSTYVCRTRNNVPGAKISEHAHANAVDIAAIELQGRGRFEIRNRPLDDPEGKFQAAIRKGSCATFTTVLGPRSNAAHATHFHFDMAERRGGYRLCDLAPRVAEGSEAP